jgi:hypothetical protein
MHSRNNLVALGIHIISYRVRNVNTAQKDDSKTFRKRRIPKRILRTVDRSETFAQYVRALRRFGTIFAHSVFFVFPFPSAALIAGDPIHRTRSKLARTIRGRSAVLLPVRGAGLTCHNDNNFARRRRVTIIYVCTFTSVIRRVIPVPTQSTNRFRFSPHAAGSLFNRCTAGLFYYVYAGFSESPD